MASGETRWLDQDQQHSWRAYIMGTTLLLDRLDRDLRAAFDLSLTEYEVLVRLSEQPSQGLRMALLADALSHSRSRVTHTISRMQKAGLVERCETPGDGRGVEARMTAHGREVLERAAHLHVRGVREHLVDLAAPEDFAALGRIFDRVSDELLAGCPDEMDIR
jgi:DNA-binding MarR family transcriptional regulator